MHELSYTLFCQLAVSMIFEYLFLLQDQSGLAQHLILGRSREGYGLLSCGLQDFTLNRIKGHYPHSPVTVPCVQHATLKGVFYELLLFIRTGMGS